MLNPATALFHLDEILSDIDMVLLMSVNPGFGGQNFIPHALDKIRILRQTLDESEVDMDIEVDGGVNPENAGEIKESGANPSCLPVSGRSHFR